MSRKTGRNEPCPCKSGIKYKRCCLPREEAERLEAARQQELWDLEDDELGGDEFVDDVSDDVVGDPPPFDFAAVERIRYERGFVRDVEGIETGDGLRATEWLAPAIPQDLVERLTLEAVDELDGYWGEPAPGEPTQIDIIELHTADDTIFVEILNRATLLLRGSEEITRLHRACVALEEASDRGVDVPAGFDGETSADLVLQEPPAFALDEVLEAQRHQRGRCELCDTEITKTAARRHLERCAPEHDVSTGPLQELLHVRVTAPGSPGYWLDLEVRADATLAALDGFLRGIWLECCGHLSRFDIGGVEYTSLRLDDGFGSMFGRRPARSMNAKIAKALALAGDRFTYEYDFGSTTVLQLDVRGARPGRIGRRAVRLAARNMPLVWPCADCGEPATHVCVACIAEDGNPFVCEAHAEAHPCEEGEALRPVVNSPRMGVCGYGG